MRSSRWASWFAIFFDPKLPLLFIVGSVALAVLGNAVYDLLTDVVGAQPQTLLSVSVVAVLIFFLAVLAFQRIVARSRPRQSPAIPAEQQAAPHAALILPVGLNESGPERAIINWHLQQRRLRHCWLLASPKVQADPKFGDLKQWLLEENVEAHVVSIADEYQSQMSYQAVMQALDEAQTKLDSRPWIVDITSGTKAMTAGMVLACRDTNTALQYLASTRNARGEPTDESVVMTVALQLAQEGT
ncbi:MAG: hypothetical protein MUD01_04945 [Chloroflexaceae bacterium]|nr:hypothetical protein [Chloroflexaceae bacterium]